MFFKIGQIRMNQHQNLLNPSNLCAIGELVGRYASQQFENEPCRTSPLSGKQYIAELLSSNARRIHEVLRMPKSTFLDLQKWLIRHGNLVEGRKMSTEQQLSMFLAVVGHRCTNREVQERYQVSGFTVTK